MVKNKAKLAEAMEKIKKAAKEDFEDGVIPVTEIAKKHGVARSTVLKWQKKEKWSRKKRKKRAKSKPKEKPKEGRPPKYKAEYNQQATELCMLGYTNEQLAVFFKVNEDTIYDWKKQHKEFSEALSEGREDAGRKVVASLFQRATGYSCQEAKVEMVGDQIVKKIITKKQYPPEVKAITLWLKNKYPELWKEKQEIEGSMEIKLGDITKEDVDFVKGIFDGITEK